MQWQVEASWLAPIRCSLAIRFRHRIIKYGTTFKWYTLYIFCFHFPICVQFERNVNMTLKATFSSIILALQDTLKLMMVNILAVLLGVLKVFTLTTASHHFKDIDLRPQEYLRLIILLPILLIMRLDVPMHVTRSLITTERILMKFYSNIL